MGFIFSLGGGAKTVVITGNHPLELTQSSMRATFTGLAEGRWLTENRPRHNHKTSLKHEPGDQTGGFNVSQFHTCDRFIQHKDKFSQLTAQQPLKISPNSSRWTVEAADYTATIHITIGMSVFA